MLELVMTVCLIANSAKCKDVHLQFAEESLTPYQCVMKGQLEMAKWREGNPNWQIAKWGCGRVKLQANI